MILAAARRLALIASLTAGVLLLAGCGGSDSEDEAAKRLSPRQLVSKAAPSVVSVHNKSDGDSIHGSGFVFDADRGLIVTAASVIWDTDSLQVALQDGRKLNGRLVARSPCTDIAVIVLQPNPGGLKALPMGRSSALQAGETVSALGITPTGGAEHADLPVKQAHEVTATRGTVTAANVSVSFTDSLPDFPSVVQHQAPLTSSIAGGPLVNGKGQVVAVSTLIDSFDDDSRAGSSRLSYGIGADHVRRRMAQLRPTQRAFYEGWAAEHECHDQFQQLVRAYRGTSGAKSGTSGHSH